MHVLILGGGVVGVTNAFYLARAGHDVTVVERQAGPALESSKTNAGLIAPGHSFAWASPRAPGLLIRSLWRRDLAFRLRLKRDPRLWAWGLRFLRECTSGRARANTVRKLALCRYSQRQLTATRAETGIDDHAYAKGLLYFYRDPAHFEQGIANMKLLEEHGQKVEVIDAERCVAIEPALAAIRDKLAGAVYCPTDGSGDSQRFTEQLADKFRRLRGLFRFETTVKALRASGDAIEAVVTDKGEMRADLYVLALGSYSPLIARTAGVKLPIYPVKGYSLTAPITDAAAAPTVGGVDEGALIAYCRMGDRLRMTATADFAGYDTGHQPADFAEMTRVGRELFPHGIDFDRPEHHACLRPMTPDGAPILGRGRHPNLYFNTGQGHMGWTMACGSGRIVTDLIEGHAPDIDASAFSIERFG